MRTGAPRLASPSPSPAVYQGAHADDHAHPLPGRGRVQPEPPKFDGPPPMCIDPSKRYTATMVTTKGTLTIALDPIGAPQTINNFVFLARYHYFDGIVFHRIIPGFVLPGRRPDGHGRGGPGYRFADELPAPGRYELGSLAMANAGPNTNGSQFFVISGPSGVRPAAAVLAVRQGGRRAGRGGGHRRHRHAGRARPMRR